MQVYLHDFLPFRKEMKDENGAVDESSSEQQFHKSDMITLVV